MAVEVEGVEGPSGTPQGIDGDRSRTRHLWVTRSIYMDVKRSQARVKMTTVTDHKKSEQRDVLLKSIHKNSSNKTTNSAFVFLDREQLHFALKLICSKLQTLVFNALSVFSLLLVGTNPVAFPPSSSSSST